MDTEKRMEATFRFFTGPMRSICKQKFNYTWDSLKDVPGPYLLLANHNTNWDPMLLGVACERPVRFVATENVLRNKTLGPLLVRYLNPIIHMKGKLGAKTTIEILRTLKNGGNVCIFPEGNRSFYGVTGEIPEVTGRLAKKCGASLVTYRLEGGYLTQPRWSKSFRKGKLTGRLMHVYSPEELKLMTEAEVQNAICRDLHEDAYETQQRENIPFLGKNLAEGMESALYCCPKCGKFSALRSKGDEIFCSCGYRARYDVYGILRDPEGNETAIRDLAAKQHRRLEEAAAGDPATALFSDTVTVGELIDHTLPETKTLRFVAYPDRFTMGGTVITPKELVGTAIFSRNTLLAHVDLGSGVKQYEIKGSDSFSAVKYTELYRIMQNKNTAEVTQA